jgi:hypothetical protein
MIHSIESNFRGKIPGRAAKKFRCAWFPNGEAAGFAILSMSFNTIDSLVGR